MRSVKKKNCDDTGSIVWEQYSSLDADQWARIPQRSLFSAQFSPFLPNKINTELSEESLSAVWTSVFSPYWHQHLSYDGTRPRTETSVTKTQEKRNNTAGPYLFHGVKPTRINAVVTANTVQLRVDSCLSVCVAVALERTAEFFLFLNRS